MPRRNSRLNRHGLHSIQQLPVNGSKILHLDIDVAPPFGFAGRFTPAAHDPLGCGLTIGIGIEKNVGNVGNVFFSRFVALCFVDNVSIPQYDNKNNTTQQKYLPKRGQKR